MLWRSAAISAACAIGRARSRSSTPSPFPCLRSMASRSCLSLFMEEIMADNRRNSLLPMSLPTRNDLRSALAQIVRSVQAEHGLTDEALADLLGVSDGTIRNVRHKRTDLNQEPNATPGPRSRPPSPHPS